MSIVNQTALESSGSRPQRASPQFQEGLAEEGDKEAWELHPKGEGSNQRGKEKASYACASIISA